MAQLFNGQIIYSKQFLAFQQYLKILTQRLVSVRTLMGPDFFKALCFSSGFCSKVHFCLLQMLCNNILCNFSPQILMKIQWSCTHAAFMWQFCTLPGTWLHIPQDEEHWFTGWCSKSICLHGAWRAEVQLSLEILEVGWGVGAGTSITQGQGQKTAYGVMPKV